MMVKLRIGTLEKTHRSSIYEHYGQHILSEIADWQFTLTRQCETYK